MAYSKRSLSLKEYLTDEFNVKSWREIEQHKYWKGIFKQKAFFDSLYKEFDFFAEHAYSYYDITNHFGKLTLRGLKRHCILYYLIQAIDKYYYSSDLDEGVLAESHKFIFELFVETDKEIFPAEEKSQFLNFDEIPFNDNVPKKEQQISLIGVTNEKVPFIGDLLHNLNLSEIVLDYYYRLVQQPDNREQVSQYYVGNLNRHNNPYEVSIYGAYVNMKDWEWLKMKIDNKYPPFDKVSENELEAAAKQYAIGFKYGYFNFEKDKLNQSIFQDSVTKAQIIFDFAKGRMFPSSGFSENSGKGVHVLEDWKNDGIKGGYIYRAWYLMLENHYTFAPLFEKWKAAQQNQKKSNPEMINTTGFIFSPDTYGKDEIIKLLNFCSTQVEKFQINNNLDDAFNKIPDNGKKYVFSNKFEFLQKLRIELENNAALFANDEPKFREIEKWTLYKMNEKVISTPIDLKFSSSQLKSELTNKKIITIKPKFNPDAVPVIFDLIKNYFSDEQQSKLNEILETGHGVTEPLIFLTNGNRLADAFKQLIDGDIITGCTKRELEKWISDNFQYRYRQKIKEFKLHYLNDIISTTKDKCKNAILNVSVEKATGKYLIKKA